MSSNLDKLKYKFVIENSNGTKEETKELKFNNVNFLDLKLFNRFWNRNAFESTHKITIQTWGLNWHDVAEQTDWTSFLDKKYWIDYIGIDIGYDDGIDICILKPGTEGLSYSCNQLTFNVKITLDKNNSSTKLISKDFYKNDTQEFFKNYAKKILEGKFEDSLGYSLLKHIINNLYVILENNDTWLSQGFNNNFSINIDKGLDNSQSNTLFD